MSNYIILLVLFSSPILVTFAQNCATDQKVLFCYFSSWAVYRNESGEFAADYIDPTLCTHLVYAFAGLGLSGTIESMDTWADISLSGFSKFVALKEQNPCLKTLLAIGGWNQGSMRYSVMASDADYRRTFIDSVIRFLVTYEFDGLDIDWEYPTTRGGIPEDKANLGLLLKELKETLQPWDLLLTIAVPISTSVIQAGYDMATINTYVDYVLIMGYDFTPTDSSVTGLISPLNEIDTSIKLWLKVLPASKIVLGVPAYGRSFTLLLSTDNGIGAATDGPGAAGIYTEEPGFLSYSEVIRKLLTGIYTSVYVPGAENYYAYARTDWIAYETRDNYITKAQYALNNNLGGMMVWAVDTDDFEAIFNSTFAVINTIRDTLYA